jgi:hypothetical protein
MFPSDPGEVLANDRSHTAHGPKPPTTSRVVSQSLAGRSPLAIFTRTGAGSMTSTVASKRMPLIVPALPLIVHRTVAVLQYLDAQRQSPAHHHIEIDASLESDGHVH